MYFNAHVCLAAYMNILRSLNATCIISQTVACDVTTANPISLRHC